MACAVVVKWGELPGVEFMPLWTYVINGAHVGQVLEMLYHAPVHE
jgi:hypothetical protein